LLYIGIKVELYIIDEFRGFCNEEDYASFNPKKPRLTWTAELHKEFVEAIKAIEPDSK